MRTRPRGSATCLPASHAPAPSRKINSPVRLALAKLMAAAELVTITERIAACRDPTDDKFLELAVNGHADLIVSGDSDLLALNPFRDIPIVTPAMFAQGAARAQKLLGFHNRCRREPPKPSKRHPRGAWWV